MSSLRSDRKGSERREREGSERRERESSGKGVREDSERRERYHPDFSEASEISSSSNRYRDNSRNRYSQFGQPVPPPRPPVSIRNMNPHSLPNPNSDQNLSSANPSPNPNPNPNTNPNLNPYPNPNHDSSANLYPYRNSPRNTNPNAEPTFSNPNAISDSNYNNFNFPSSRYNYNDRISGSTSFSNPNRSQVFDRQSPRPISNFSTKNDRMEEGRRYSSPNTLQNSSSSQIERSNSFANPVGEAEEGVVKGGENEVSDVKECSSEVDNDENDDDEDYDDDDSDGSDDGGKKGEGKTSKTMRWKNTYTQMLSENGVQLTKESRESTEKIPCLVCKQFVKGWEALRQHAKSTVTRKKSLEHSGYALALEELLGHSNSEKPEGLRKAEVKRARMDDIVWPPVLIVQNTRTGYKGGKYEGLGNEEVKKSFGDCGALHAKPKYNFKGHMGVNFLEFPRTEGGYLKAMKLKEEMQEARRGRDDWGRVSVGVGRKGEETDRRLVGEDGEKVLYAYMATKEDMEKWDGQKNFVKWKMVSYVEMVEEPTKKAKVENIELLNRNQFLEAKWQQNEKDLENMEKRQSETVKQMKEMEMSFKQKLEEVEAARARAENENRQEIMDLQNQMSIKHRILEEKEQKLRHASQLANSVQKEKEKAEREKSLLREQEYQYVEMLAKASEREMELKAQQEKDFLKMKEENERTRIELMKKFEKERLEETEKNEKERSQNELAKTQEELKNECCICTEEFDGGENQRIAFACGHAQTCLGCAEKLRKGKGFCPICRKKVGNKSSFRAVFL